MSDNMSGPFKPAGSAKTTQKGAFGGGTAYTQMPAGGGDFKLNTPVAGHTQKLNVKPVVRQTPPKG